jgi:hypothetical protein
MSSCWSRVSRIRGSVRFWRGLRVLVVLERDRLVRLRALLLDRLRDLLVVRRVDRLVVMAPT